VSWWSTTREGLHERSHEAHGIVSDTSILNGVIKQRAPAVLNVLGALPPQNGDLRATGAALATGRADGGLVGLQAGLLPAAESSRGLRLGFDKGR
jgi:hypothetical protein